jgi:hypothetical protein
MPAVQSLAIALRRRRVAYPRWFRKALAARQLFASALFERQAAEPASQAIRVYEQLIAERGAAAAAASERTRQLAGL